MDPTEPPAQPRNQPPTAAAPSHAPPPPPPPCRPPEPPFRLPPQPYMTGRPGWQLNPPHGGMPPGSFQPHFAPQPWGFQHPPAGAGAVPHMRPVASNRVPGTQWLEVRTNTGGVFWHNEATGQGTWERPPGVAAAALAVTGEGAVGPTRSALRPLDPAKAAMLLARAKASGAVVAPQYACLAIEAPEPATSKAKGAVGSALSKQFVVQEVEEVEDDLFFTEEDIAGEVGGQHGRGNANETAPATGATRKPSAKPPVALKPAVNHEENFKTLLAEKGVHGFSRYERELPKLQPDPRFITLPSAHRRRVFEEFCAAVGQAGKKKPVPKGETPAREASRAAAATKAAEDAFKALLQERATQSNARWHRLDREFAKDSRSSGVPPSRQEALFRTHIDSLSRVEEARERAERRARHETHAAEERQRQAGRADAMSNFKTLLAEAVHDSTAPWTEVRPRLEQDPQGRATHPLLDPIDAEKAFREHVSALENAAADAFVEMLQEKRLGDGVVWEEVEIFLQEEPRFYNLPVDRRRATWDWYKRGQGGGAADESVARAAVEAKKEDSRDLSLERDSKRARRDEPGTAEEEGERP